MTPDEAIAEAQAGKLRPIYLVLGEERLLRTRVVNALREATVKGAIRGFNEDEFTAGDSPIGRVLGAARTLPMMAKLRWVLVRDLERWEGKASRDAKAGDETKDDGDETEASESQQVTGGQDSGALDQLAAYAQQTAPSCVLVLTAAKLNAKRRLLTQAKKEGFLVSCEPLARNELTGWLMRAAADRGGKLTNGAADLIAEVSGPDLATLEDIVERLTLFAGNDPITEDTVGELIPIVRPATVWELLDAVGVRDRGRVLTLLERVYDPGDRGLRLLGVLAWSARQLIRFQAGLAAGQNPNDAARAAGAPPFRARALQEQAKRFSKATLESWLVRLRDIDLALKGGSKRPARAVLETALLDLCGQ
ncbi:MAG TPA: DNA polymerase III subunit delta [Polyangiaceae bacterium]|jgi:DNA polymerase-3 subunit delta|nr:DNA polymerase III subunit delta [Polyangiaceae bacterium]